MPLVLRIDVLGVLYPCRTQSSSDTRRRSWTTPRRVSCLFFSLFPWPFHANTLVKILIYSPNEHIRNSATNSFVACDPLCATDWPFVLLGPPSGSDTICIGHYLCPTQSAPDAIRVGHNLHRTQRRAGRRVPCFVSRRGDGHDAGDGTGYKERRRWKGCGEWPGPPSGERWHSERKTKQNNLLFLDPGVAHG